MFGNLLMGLLSASSFPKNDPNLRLWLDGADGATITQSGGLVSQWLDKSSFANALTQPDNALKPTFLAAELNGLSVLGFANKAIDYISSVIFLSNAQPFGLHYVMKFDSTVGLNIWQCLNDGSAPSHPPFVDYDAGKISFWGGSGNWVSFGATASPGTTNYRIIQIMFKGGSPTDIANFEIWMDGVSLSLTTLAADFGLGNAVGSYRGDLSPASVTLNGKIAEVCVTRSYSNRLAYQEYFEDKWAL